MQSATTAEWNCTRCGATNRKLVPTDTTEAKDRCVNCGPKSLHVISPGERPVRWTAKLAS